MFTSLIARPFITFLERPGNKAIVYMLCEKYRFGPSTDFVIWVHALCKQFVDFIVQIADSYVHDIYMDTLSHVCSMRVCAIRPTCTYVLSPTCHNHSTLVCVADAMLFAAGKASMHVVNAEARTETESDSQS